MRFFSGIRYVFTLAGLLLPLSVFAAPRIAVDSPTHDFGSVRIKGDAPTVDHVFTLSNTGDEELVISGVNTSCGCTTARLTTDHLPPGQTVALNTSLSLKGRRGEMSKTITVSSNDPDTPKLNLTLKVNAEQDVDVSPAYVTFRVDPGVQKTTESLVLIRFNSPTPYKISGFNPKALEFCTVELEELRAGFEYQLRFKLNNADSLKEPRRTEMFVLNTDHPDMPVLQIPVSYYSLAQPVQKAMSVYPQYITLPAQLANGSPFKHTMLIRSNLNRPLSVLSITPPNDTVAISTQQVSAAYVRFEVTFSNVDSSLDGKSINIQAGHVGDEPEQFQVPIRLR